MRFHLSQEWDVKQDITFFCDPNTIYQYNFTYKNSWELAKKRGHISDKLGKGCFVVLFCSVCIMVLFYFLCNLPLLCHQCPSNYLLGRTWFCFLVCFTHPVLRPVLLDMEFNEMSLWSHVWMSQECQIVTSILNACSQFLYFSHHTLIKVFV